MPVTYLVGVDGDSDGVFTDIGADVLALDWRLGLAEPEDTLAAPATAAITVRNPNRVWSPEVNALLPGTPLRIQSDDGTTVRTHFTGFISRVEPQPGEYGARTAVIYAEGADAAFGQHRIRLPPQVNVRADTVIARVLAQMTLRQPHLKGRWLLGRAGHSELGRNTRLPVPALAASLQTGQSVLAYVGDTWLDGIPADAAIRQVAEAERGRFFLDREGEAVFYNRHHLLRPGAAAVTLEDNMDGLTYTYGDSTISRVQVWITPRSVGAAGSRLWMLDAPQRLPPGDTPQPLVARFRDADYRPLGALVVLPPVRGLDYSANTRADGTGDDRSALVDVTLRAADFSAATLEIRNRSCQPVYLRAELRGTPVVHGSPLAVEHTYRYGLAVYGLRQLAFALPALDALEEADRLARYELARRKTPRGLIHRLTLSSRTHRAHILARTLFDRVTVREAQTGHAARYFIVAEAHTVDRGGERHRVTWTLEADRAGTFWLVGGSRLRRDTVVGY